MRKEEVRKDLAPWHSEGVYGIGADPKHLQRYVDEFSGRHNVRNLDTLDQMVAVAKGLDNKRLRYRDLLWGNAD